MRQVLIALRDGVLGGLRLGGIGVFAGMIVLVLIIGVMSMFSPSIRKEASEMLSLAFGLGTGRIVVRDEESVEIINEVSHRNYRIPDLNIWIRWPNNTKSRELPKIVYSSGRDDSEIPFIRQGEPCLSIIHDRPASPVWVYAAKLSSWDDDWLVQYTAWLRSRDTKGTVSTSIDFSQWTHGTHDQTVCWSESVVGNYRALVVNIGDGSSFLRCEEISNWFVLRAKRRRRRGAAGPWPARTATSRWTRRWPAGKSKAMRTPT